MKLLLDEHLSPKLAKRLQDLYPDSSQVDLLKKKGADDLDLLCYARDHNFVIVSKDDDFYDLAIMSDGPPKVVVLRVGNVTTEEIERKLRKAAPILKEFVMDPDFWCCEIR